MNPIANGTPASTPHLIAPGEPLRSLGNASGNATEASANRIARNKSGAHPARAAPSSSAIRALPVFIRKNVAPQKSVQRTSPHAARPRPGGTPSVMPGSENTPARQRRLGGLDVLVHHGLALRGVHALDR